MSGFELGERWGLPIRNDTGEQSGRCHPFKRAGAFLSITEDTLCLN